MTTDAPLHDRLTAAAPGPVIQTRSLGFSYPDADRPAVRDVSFTVERGEIFGFLGPEDEEGCGRRWV